MWDTLSQNLKNCKHMANKNRFPHVSIFLCKIIYITLQFCSDNSDSGSISVIPKTEISG